MSKVKYSFDVVVSFDTDEYRTPTDGKLGLSLKDEIAEAIEVNTSLEVCSIRITQVKKYTE